MQEVYTDLEKKTKDSFKSYVYDVLTDGELSAEDCYDKITAYINENFIPKKAVKVDWVQEWLELFPKGMKTGGKLVRSDKKGCQEKMEIFLRMYKYNKDFIMQVTKDYIEDTLENGGYLRSAIYLIGKKGEGSELAALCENYTPPKKQYTNHNDFV